MTKSRYILLLVSLAVAVLLLGGGIMAKMGAVGNSFSQARLFAQVFSAVSQNYVDPIDEEEVIRGACEGMLAGLDSRGAYLAPDEVELWKSDSKEDRDGPGLMLLKAFGVMQVVRVSPGSPADQAGIEPGDQVRAIDDRNLSDSSLDQVYMMLEGQRGSQVRLQIVHPEDSFRREDLVLTRDRISGPAYSLGTVDGVAVLTVADLGRIDSGELASEMEHLSSRGTDSILLDLRNLVDRNFTSLEPLASIFLSGNLLTLQDRSGRTVSSIEIQGTDTTWNGPVGLLVNGATAGSPEGLASLLQHRLQAEVYGEATYGMGTEPELFELPEGSGVLLPVKIWRVAGGQDWAGGGVTPDHVIRPEGRDYEERAGSQLKSAVEMFRQATEQDSPQQAA